jgi:zinc protease
VVFGTRHPYGRPPTGTESSTSAITRADVQSFYDTWYRPNNAVMIVVGDVRPDDLVTRVQSLFGAAWERREVPAVDFGTPQASGTSHIYVVDKPAAPQSSVRIGTVGVPRSSQDYFPLLVMNTVLGGSFTSRLNQNLRETHGYTYGARSSFAMRREAGPFVASAEVVGTKTDSSLIEFFRELRAVSDTIPRDELEKTKRYLQLQLPGDFETTGGIASEMLAVALYDLPLDYFDSYTDRIAAVTQADVQRVARKYVQAGAMQVVVVGDRESIEPAIRATGIANVSVRPFEIK